MSDQPLLNLAYLGNFKPPHSTENDYRRAWQANGHAVTCIQEGDPVRLAGLIEDLDTFNFVLWTRTEDLAAKNGEALQWKFLAEARRKSVPVIGVHLDRWWGLRREHLIERDPFFRVDLLLTADGGHQEQWEKAGVNHQWLPPGISETWCKPGNFREEYASEIAFVGSWQGGYHKEARHRHELVRWLERNYDGRIRFWPQQGQLAVRGNDLTDLYWSVRVIVGDSCVFPGDTHYCSDRIPETVGRGGYLLHPAVEGIVPDGIFYNGEWPLCDYWHLGDWEELRARIDTELEDPDGGWASKEDRLNRIEMIRENHTYEKRVPQIIEYVKGLK